MEESQGIYFGTSPGISAGFCAEISIGIPDWIAYATPLLILFQKSLFRFLKEVQGTLLRFSYEIPVGILLVRKLSRGISEIGSESNSGFFPRITVRLPLRVSPGIPQCISSNEYSL